MASTLPFDKIVQLDLMQPNFVNIVTKQYDDAGRRILIRLMQEGEVIDIPSGAVFTYSVSKPDKTFVKGTASTVTVDSVKYVAIVLTKQMLAVYGKEIIDITMTVGSKTISTMTFINSIQRAAVQDEDVESTSEWGTVDEVLQYANEAAASATSAASSASAAQVSQNSASTSATSAASSASSASTSAANAATSEDNAATSAAAAAESATAAAESEANAMSATPDGYAELASTFNALGLYVDDEGYVCQAIDDEDQD